MGLVAGLAAEARAVPRSAGSAGSAGSAAPTPSCWNSSLEAARDVEAALGYS